MIDPKILDEITRTLYGSLPRGLDQLQKDTKENVRAALSSALARMDLVTREEFDVQAGVLGRTREKLSQLEKKVIALEQALSAASRPKKQGE